MNQIRLKERSLSKEEKANADNGANTTTSMIDNDGLMQLSLGLKTNCRLQNI